MCVCVARKKRSHRNLLETEPCCVKSRSCLASGPSGVRESPRGMISFTIPDSIFYIPLKRRLVRFISLHYLWNACLFWEGARNGTNFGVTAKRLNLDSHKKTTTKPEKSKAKKSQRVRSWRGQNKNRTTTVAVCDQQATVLC